MGNAKLEQIILQTIDIIASKKIASAGFNRTIQATILSCEDATQGKYKVKYQDSIFNAYTENTTVSYTNGSSVFVLIPNGDMSQTKTILGAVSKAGVDYVNATLQQEYNIIGNNVILNENNTELCSYQTKSIILYNKDLNDDDNILKLDKIATKEYLNNSDCIIITANIRTELPEDQKNQGNYGILLGLDYNDPTTGEVFTRYYSLDVDNMDGNPYNFIEETQQKKVFDIDKENFLNINTIALFVKDFPNQDENITQNDIFISNISLVGAERIDLSSLNTYALLLNTPKGYIFTDYDTDNSTRTIETEIRIKGQRLNTSDYSNIQYFWFIEDNSMTTYNSYYNKYGGQGWKCLNQYNVIKEAQVENGIEVTPAVFDFISGQDTFTVFKKDILVNRVKYKCVVVYNNNILSKEITILNTDAEYNFNITSDLGTKFYLNNGQPTLTCICQKKNTEGIYQIVDRENFNYIWAVVNSVGNFNIPSNDQNYVIDKNIMKVKVRTITNFSFFKCSIFTSNNNIYLGTVSLTLSNSLQDDTKGYSLIINNKDQVFKYSTTGLAPTNQQLDNPIKILALDFNIYNQIGQPLDEELVKNCDISWKIPKSSYSLIKPDTSYIKEEGHELDSYDIYKNLISFVFDIEDSYNFYKTENQIELQVVYNGIKLFGRTNLVFIKQGEEGTNGTSFVCKIVPKVDPGAIIPINPTIYYDGTNVTFNWQRNRVQYNKWFDIQFWHNGSLLYYGNQPSHNTPENIILTIVNWEILHNTYSATVKDNALINITKENDNWSFSLNISKVADTNFINWRFANIVKVTVRYDGKLYYATLPINFCRIWNNKYKLDFVENTGFTKVLYSSNGINPLYDNHSPFIVNTLQKQTDGTWKNISFNSDIKYEWYYIGSVYQRNSDENINSSWIEDYETSSYDENTEERISSNKWLSNYIPPDRVTIAKNVKYVKPVDIYNGQCVNVGLACRVYTTNSLLCWIFMPIHMLLNRYENSAINTWDGNSVELGTKGGMILAPQVGAGVKDDENGFTGIFMGTVKDPEEQLSKSVSMFNSFNSLNEDVGLFGYSKGERSIFLDAKTGKALFGKRGAGQIIIDPSTNQAIIQGGNYIPKEEDSQNKGSGMQINLSEPSINFGSGKFKLEPDGTLTAVGANLSAIKLSSENSTYDGKPFSQMFKDNYQELIDAAVDSLQKQIDGQIMTWYNDGVPTLNNYPYSEWVVPGSESQTAKEIAKHQGDIYYDRLTQYSYRFTNLGTQENPNWSWELIRDEGIATAIQKSAQAQAAADGKRRIFTIQPVYNDTYDVGDLWVNVDYKDDNVEYNNDILICKTAKESKTAFNINHWQKASSYLDSVKYQPRTLMKKLTDNNKDNGIWMSPQLTDNKLYINASYINTGIFSVTNPDTKQETFHVNANDGTVKIVADQFSLTSGDTIESIAASKANSALSNAKDYADTLLQSGYGICLDNADVINKTVTINNLKQIKIGTKISVYFRNANTAASPTLNVNNTGTFPIYARAALLTQQYYWQAGAIVDFIYRVDNRWDMVVENQLEIFNKLTKNGKNQGIYLNDGSIYVNASMIQSGAINIKKGDTTTFYADANSGDVNIIAKSFKLSTGDTIESIATSKANTALSSAKSYTDTALTVVKAGYGTCSTAEATVAKVVSCDGFALYKGAQLDVLFTYANTATAPTLNVNGTGAKAIYARGAVIAKRFFWNSNALVRFTYTGSYWLMETEDQLETFNRLTNGGANQGIYLEDSKLYINASYIRSGEINIKKGDIETFYADTKTGIVRINADSISITSNNTTQTVNQIATSAATSAKNSLSSIINSLTAGSVNLLRGTNKEQTAGSKGTWGKSTWRRAGAGTGLSCSSISDFKKGTVKYGWKIVNSGSATGIAQDNVPMEAGKVYTISCYVKGKGKLTMRYGAQEYKDFAFTLTSTVSKWTRKYKTFKALSASGYVVGGKTTIWFMNHASGTLQVCGMKLEEGSFVSDWSESPLDIEENEKARVKEYDNSLTQRKIFNKLTNNGEKQGIYLKDGKVYIDASMIDTGEMSANRIRTGRIESKDKLSSWNLNFGTFKTASKINGVKTNEIRLEEGNIEIYYKNNIVGTFSAKNWGRAWNNANGVAIGLSSKASIFAINAQTYGSPGSNYDNKFTYVSKDYGNNGKANTLNAFCTLDMHGNEIKNYVFKNTANLQRITYCLPSKITNTGIVREYYRVTLEFRNGLLWKTSKIK